MTKLNCCLFVVIASLFFTQCGSFEGTQRRSVARPLIELVFDTPQDRFNKAVIEGDVVRVKRYASPSWVNQPVDGEYPLVRAVATNNDAMVQALVAAGANWNVRSRNSKSLAYVAGYKYGTETGIRCAKLGGGTVADAEAGNKQYQSEEPMRKVRRWVAERFGKKTIQGSRANSKLIKSGETGL